MKRLALALAFCALLLNAASAQLNGGLMFPGPGTPASSGAATTTLDPAFTNGAMALSNGNLTATHVSGNGVLRSIANHSSGKYYWEITVTVSANAPIMGICSSTEVNSTFLTSDGKSAAIFSGSGWLSGGTLSGTTTAPNANLTHTYGFAMDATNKTIWVVDVTAGTGQWNANATANPVTNTNGANFSAASDLGTASLYPAITLSGSDSATFNFGATAYAGTPPVGFGNL
jgi:hypothetical protein